MLQLVEMEGKLNEKGCIEIPAVMLEQTGIRTGETVKLIYMAEEEELKNESKEFLLVRAEQDAEEELMKEQNIVFQIPQELLQDAGIPMDADLDIVCQEQKIIILPAQMADETPIPEELLMICKEFGVSEDKVKILFATAYNRYGEGKPWTQGRVRQFFSEDELCISKDFWNLICKSENGYNIVIDEYRKNAHYINEALDEIKDAYLPNDKL